MQACLVQYIVDMCYQLFLFEIRFNLGYLIGRDSLTFFIWSFRHCICDNYRFFPVYPNSDKCFHFSFIRIYIPVLNFRRILSEAININRFYFISCGQNAINHNTFPKKKKQLLTFNVVFDQIFFFIVGSNGHWNDISFFVPGNGYHDPMDGCCLCHMHLKNEGNMMFPILVSMAVSLYFIPKSASETDLPTVVFRWLKWFFRNVLSNLCAKNITIRYHCFFKITRFAHSPIDWFSRHSDSYF